jgi:hypothetical protein
VSDDAKRRLLVWIDYEIAQHQHLMLQHVTAESSTDPVVARTGAIMVRARLALISELGNEKHKLENEASAWCECSDRMSGGVPCPPGTCPNAGKPPRQEKPASASLATPKRC